MPVITDAGIGLTKVRNLNRNAYRRAQRVCRFMSVEFVVFLYLSSSDRNRGGSSEYEVEGQTVNLYPVVPDLSGLVMLFGKILYSDTLFCLSYYMFFLHLELKV